MKDKNKNEILCKSGTQNAIKNDEIIKSLFEKYHIDKNNIFFKISLQWGEITKGDFYEHVKPYELKNNVLYLLCDNSAWASEFQFEKKTLICKLKKLFPENKVSNIRAIVKK
ncbi:MAG: DUF721 domain-containing protein [Sphaerochaetaceae bacterium]